MCSDVGVFTLKRVLNRTKQNRKIQRNLYINISQPKQQLPGDLIFFNIDYSVNVRIKSIHINFRF